MNSDAISKLEEQITKRDMESSLLKLEMLKIVCLNCMAQGIPLAAIILLGKDVNCIGLWPHRLGFPFLSVAWLLVFRDKMLDYLKCCKDQDEDIEKLEALKGAAGPDPARVHTNLSMIVLLLVVLNVIGYIYGSVLFKVACDRP